jgi:3D (Asp-Asp-Asp) domain-containing protein
VRVGAPIVAVVVAGFLLPAAGGTDRAAQEPAKRETQAPADTITVYADLTRRALTLREQRRSAERALAVTRRSLDRSQRRLATRLRTLYQHGRPDPLEVVLGARSLDHAMVSIESLERIGREEAKQVRNLRRARATLARLVRKLRAQEAEAAAIRREAAALLRARAAPTLSGRAAPMPDEQIVDQPGPAPSPPPAPTGAGRLTVVALGYSIAGITASGLPAGLGTVAVDASVIPLGTVLTIPGYGRGVAADTGGAIRGAVIDLWFPSAQQARAWGRRVVTIDLHPG